MINKTKNSGMKTNETPTRHQTQYLRMFHRIQMEIVEIFVLL